MTSPDVSTPQVTEIAIAVVQDGEQFLVGLRPEGVPLAGYSEFPGGKMDAGERPEVAACRECFEETGLAVEARHSYPEVLHSYKHGTVRLHFINCRPTGCSTAPRTPFRWISRQDLIDLKFPEANAGLIAHLTRESSPPSESSGSANF